MSRFYFNVWNEDGTEFLFNVRGKDQNILEDVLYIYVEALNKGAKMGERNIKEAMSKLLSLD